MTFTELTGGIPVPAGIETEYKTVRDEILSRINMRQQIVAVTLTLAGAFLGVGISQPTVALVYPPLAAFVALAWSQNDFRIRDLAMYIREVIEPALPGVRWESYIKARRLGDPDKSKRGLGSWRFVVLSHGGVFLFTQLIAMVVGALGLIGNPRQLSRSTISITITLGIIDITAVALVLWVISKAWSSARPTRRKDNTQEAT